ncbi:MAG: HU family DNA-binding protein [Alsobacter sp.]
MDSLAVEVGRRNGLIPRQAGLLIRSVFRVTAAMIESGGGAIPGFGKLLPVDRPARSIRNPRTGETGLSKPSRTVSFRPGKPVRDRVGSHGA